MRDHPRFAVSKYITLSESVLVKMLVYKVLDKSSPGFFAVVCNFCEKRWLFGQAEPDEKIVGKCISNHYKNDCIFLRDEFVRIFQTEWPTWGDYV